MAYYDALIAKWGTAPAGTNDEKLTWINAETVTGPAIPMIVPTYQIYNLIDRDEFTALTPDLQQSVRDILAMGTVDASASTEMRTRLTFIFPDGTTTFDNLTVLAMGYDTPQISWAQANGYPVPITPQMLVEAGIIPPGPVTPLP